ncbi:MAG: alpha/beta hydrolase [Deltaproteobacteria bacterium]|nr:alpha/beta hydrolase [Deltaproteobacteria bacterium]MCB9480140.1 alpha/beta hydrolase [Deltaproteobacteria bacterium]MCB9487894.1 alpha/beta hydrolase [Deltaproteobacteria bacterium]
MTDTPITSEAETVLCDLKGGQFAYIDEGPREGYPLVFVAGVPGMNRDYRYLTPHLNNLGYRTIRLDMPGFGDSPFETWPDPTLYGRARFVDAAARALGLDKYGLFGHSMGGGPAIIAASLFPERVKYLVLLTSIGGKRHKAFDAHPWQIAMARRLLHFPPTRSYVMKQMHRTYERLRFPKPKEIPEHVFDIHLRILENVVFEKIAEATTRVNAHALLLYAHDDHLVEVEIGEDLRRRLKFSELHVFETGGHNIQKTQAMPVADLTHDFLSHEGRLSDVTAEACDG